MYNVCTYKRNMYEWNDFVLRNWITFCNYLYAVSNLMYIYVLYTHSYSRIVYVSYKCEAAPNQQISDGHFLTFDYVAPNTHCIRSSYPECKKIVFMVAVSLCFDETKEQFFQQFAYFKLNCRARSIISTNLLHYF